MLKNQPEKRGLDLYLYKASFTKIIELKHHRNKNLNFSKYFRETILQCI